jgi:predicted CoA-binding protein
MTEEGACEFPAFNAATGEIAKLLDEAKVIAVVGLSPKPERPSYGVARYLKDQGYRIIPVNPGHGEILGETCYRSLADVPGPVDIVDVFRQPDAAPQIVDEAIAKKARAVWMQLGIVHNEAAKKARAAGLLVVMNKCLKVEHAAWRRRT